MGVLLLSDYRTDLDAGLQQAVGNTLKDRWVNQALREFGYAFKFHELENLSTFVTVADTGQYILSGAPANIVDLRAIEELKIVSPGTSIGRIFPETRTRYLKLIGDRTDNTTHGVPKFYHKFGPNVFFRPVPNATLYTIEVDYYKNLTSFVNPGDTSPLHEDWDEAIYLGALYRGFRYFGEFDRYQNIRNDFLGMVRSRSTEYELEEFPEGGINPTGPNDTEDSL